MVIALISGIQDHLVKFALNEHPTEKDGYPPFIHTVIVFTLNDTVVEFTLDQDDVFRLTDDSVSIPADDTFFNVNYDESLLASLTGNGPLNVNSVN